MKRFTSLNTTLAAALAAGSLTLANPGEGNTAGSARDGSLSIGSEAKAEQTSQKSRNRFTLEAACGQDAYSFYSSAPQTVRRAIDHVYGNGDSSLSLQEIKKFAEDETAYPAVGENIIDVISSGDRYSHIDVKTGTRLGGSSTTCDVDETPKTTQTVKGQDGTPPTPSRKPQRATPSPQEEPIQKTNKAVEGYRFDWNTDGHPDVVRPRGKKTVVELGDDQGVKMLPTDYVRSEILSNIEYEAEQADFNDLESKLANSKEGLRYITENRPGYQMSYGKQGEEVAAYLMESNPAAESTRLENGMQMAVAMDNLARHSVVGSYFIANFLEEAAEQEGHYQVLDNEKARENYLSTLGSERPFYQVAISNLLGSSVLDQVLHDFSPFRQENLDLLKSLDSSVSGMVAEINQQQTYEDVKKLVTENLYSQQEEIYANQIYVNVTPVKDGGLKDW